jgi:hypothetical protein
VKHKLRLKHVIKDRCLLFSKRFPHLRNLNPSINPLSKFDNFERSSEQAFLAQFSRL